MTIRPHRLVSEGMTVDTRPGPPRSFRDEPEREARREVTITEISEQLREIYDAQPTVTRCALCDWTFEGTVVSGREAAALHRQNAHGASVPVKREEFGVEVQCKVDGCSNTAPSHGRYAKLCKTHRARGVREESPAKPETRQTRPRTVRAVGGGTNGSLAAAAQAVDTRLAEFKAAKAALADAIEDLRRATEALEAA